MLLGEPPLHPGGREDKLLGEICHTQLSGCSGGPWGSFIRSVSNTIAHPCAPAVKCCDHRMDKEGRPWASSPRRDRDSLVICNGVTLDKDATCWESTAGEGRDSRADFLEEGVCSKRQSEWEPEAEKQGV